MFYSLFGFVVLSLVCSSALAWGGDGHRIITSLARNLTNSRNIDSLLEPLGDLTEASTWADTKESRELYPESGAYHFSSTPYRNCSAFDMNRDCGFGKTRGVCIVTGLSEAISRAIDPKISQEVRTDSLKFIIHLMADIHQPLHTGFREDSGGLRVLLSEPDGMDLHTVWDSRMIDELKASIGSADLVDKLHSKLEANKGAFIQKIRAQANFTDVLSSDARITDYVAQIASDTAASVTCRSAYTGADGQWLGVGDSLSTEYFSSRLVAVTVQVFKASVRLSLLLDAIADALYTGRTLLKEARREERIRKLFERSPVDPETEQVEDPLSSNRFSPIFIDFDAVLVDSSPLIVTVPTIKSGRAPATKAKHTRANHDDDDYVLGEYMETVTKERASYVFYGVDLSEIVFRKSVGVAIISTKSKLISAAAIPACVIISIRFINKAGAIKRQDFGFDNTVFPRGMSDELIIRTILKVSGIDPRIDITDYLGTVRPHRRLLTESNSRVFGALLVEHSARTTFLDSSVPAQKSFYTNQIKRSKGKILVARLGGHNIDLFVHSDSIEARKVGSAFRTRFNRFRMVAPEEGKTPAYIYMVYVDPAIVEGAFLTDTSGNQDLMLLYDMAKTITSIEGSLKTIVGEILEVETIKREQESGVAISPHVGGEYFDWLFEYRGDEKISFHVFEWFRKGVTEREIMDSLGIKPEISRVITNDYAMVPNGFVESDFANFFTIFDALFVKQNFSISGVVQFALQRIENLREYIVALQVGRIRAFFFENIENKNFIFAQKIVSKSVDEHGNLVEDPTIYIMDLRILFRLNIPLNRLEPILSKLDTIGAGNWKTRHPLRPTLLAELRAMEYLMLSNDTAEVKFASPLREAIRAIADVKPSVTEYAFVCWMRNGNFTR